MSPQEVNTQLFNYITSMAKCADYSTLQPEVLGFVHAIDWLNHMTPEIKVFRGLLLTFRSNEEILEGAKLLKASKLIE